MRVLRFLGPHRLEVQELPDPVPREGELLVRVFSTGVCGSDLHGYTGENGRRHPGQVMGHETVGVVERVGGAAADPRVSRPVTINPVFACGQCDSCRRGQEQACAHRRVMGVDPRIVSAFAELVVAPQINVVPVEAELTPLIGALIEPLTVGYHALLRGGCRPEDRVLVVGGGPIGQAAVLAASRLGVDRVLVSDPSASRRALCERIGAPVADPLAEDLAARTRDVLGGPASLVVDAVGSDRSLGSALAASTLGARIVLVGMNAPTVSLDAYRLSTDERSLIGSFCYSAKDFTDTARWAATVTPTLELLIDRVVDLTDSPAVFGDLAAGRLDASKVLVRLTGDR